MNINSKCGRNLTSKLTKKKIEIHKSVYHTRNIWVSVCVYSCVMMKEKQIILQWCFWGDKKIITQAIYNLDKCAHIKTICKL